MREGGRAMKKLLFLGLGSALMFTMGGVGTAFADAGPHTSTAVAAGGTGVLVSQAGGGRCASCHRAHTAKAENLLKDAQPALCYTCHGGSGATLDVVDGIDNNNSGALRGGGFEYALINGAGATKSIGAVPVPDPVTGITPRQSHSAAAPAGTVEAAVTSRHQIDGTTTGTMWGNGAISDAVNPGKAGVTLECGSCHDPHGNGNYRILKPIPNDAATSAVAAKAEVVADPNASPPVVGSPAVAAVAAVVVAPINIPDALTKVYTTTDYWNVADPNVPTATGAGAPAAGVTDGYISNIAAWCTTCHTRYLAGSGSAGNDSGDAVFTYKHRSDASDKGGVSRPNCIQCHVSHGTSATMTSKAALVAAPDGAVPTPKGSSANVLVGDPTVPASMLPTNVGGTAVGTSRLLRVDNRGTCVMCHNV
jgi:predicted CXXCH cytochrome family protein